MARRLQSTWALQLWHAGSVVVVRELSCPAACGNLSSLTRGRTGVPCVARWILNHWTTREVPQCVIYNYSIVFRIAACEVPYVYFVPCPYSILERDSRAQFMVSILEIQKLRPRDVDLLFLLHSAGYSLLSRSLYISSCQSP